MKANETVTFDVTVENSVHPERVEIDASVALQGSATIEYLGGDKHRVTYTAPVHGP